MSYLLDTDTCSAYLKHHPAVFSKVMLHFGNLHISAITACELLTWGHRANAAKSRIADIRDFLSAVATQDIDLAIAEKYAQLRAEQLDRGRTIGPFDLLNAAVAMEFGFMLVTHNTKDYAGIDGLQIEDWLSP